MYFFPERKPFDTECKLAAELICRTNTSFYLTGKPGSGKTSFLQHIATKSGKKYIFLSPANEGAFANGGTTIHSFFHLPYSPFIWEIFTDTQKNIFHHYRKEKREIIEQAELIIIDDIGSVRADTIDGIDFRLRNFGGKKNLPFGGKQIVFAGDIFQLENHWPQDELEQLKTKYDTPYFFSARALMNAGFPTIELKSFYGKNDEKFVNLLTKIRRKQMLLQDIELINTTYEPAFAPLEKENFVTLTADKNTADLINREKLYEMPGPLYSYFGKIEGRFVREINDDLLPAAEVLELKENTPVVFVKDDEAGRWQRGMLAKVWAVKTDSVTVMLTVNGAFKLHLLETVTWESLRYEISQATGEISTAVVGSFTQYPVRVAWAMPVKKCQGMLFDKVIIDGAETAAGSGFTYSALARCTSLAGLKMRSPLNIARILVRDEQVRLLLSANNEKQVAAAIENGEADLLYNKAVKEFNRHSFEMAVAHLTKAISIRNDTADAVFKRFAVAKLRSFAKNVTPPKEAFQQTLIIQQQQVRPFVAIAEPVPRSDNYSVNVQPGQSETFQQHQFEAIAMPSENGLSENDHQSHELAETAYLKEALQLRQNELEVLQQTLQQNTGELAVFVQEREADRKQIAELKMQLQNVNSAFESMQQQLLQSRQELQHLVDECRSDKQQIAAIKQQMLNNTNSFENLKREVQNNARELESQARELKMERQENTSLNAQLQAAGTEIKTIKQALQNNMEAVEKIREQSDMDRSETVLLSQQLRSNTEETDSFKIALQQHQQLLDKRFAAFNDELRLQRDEFKNFREALTALNEADAARAADEKRANKFNWNLTTQLYTLETDLNKWKTITVVTGLVFCVVVTVALFVFFKI